MRYAKCTLGLLAAPLLAGGAGAAGPARTDPEHKLTEAYYEIALREIRPPDWRMARISISFGSEFKYVIRTNGKTAQLLKGAPNGDIFRQLQALDAASRLPSDPEDAVALIKYSWHEKEISAAQFENLHRQFTAALEEYVSDSQARYPTVLAKGGILRLHTPVYDIIYDNSGFEHVEIEAWDDTSSPSKTQPVIRWVHEVLQLCDGRLTGN